MNKPTTPDNEWLNESLACLDSNPAMKTEVTQNIISHIQQSYVKKEDVQGYVEEALLDRFVSKDEVEKQIEAVEEMTADIEFKAGINHVTMSGEWIHKDEVERMKRKAYKQAINDVKNRGYGYDDGTVMLKISFADLAHLSNKENK